MSYVCIHCGKQIQELNPDPDKKKAPRRKKFCSRKCKDAAACPRKNKKKISVLSDGYVRGLFPGTDVPKSLIDAKRELIKLRRFIASSDDQTPLNRGKTRGEQE